MKVKQFFRRILLALAPSFIQFRSKYKKERIFNVKNNKKLQIYYDPDDVDNTSNASYQSSVLTVKLTALFEQETESKEYKIKQRPTY